MNDQQLYEKALELDEEALTAIFDQFSPALYKYSLRSCHDPKVAENIVGDAFGQLLEQLATGSMPTKHLQTYLYKIAYQLLLKHARATPQNAFIELTLPPYKDKQFTPTSSQTKEQAEMQALITAINTALTYEQRHVIILRFLDDFSLKQTSLIMGKTVHSVKALQYRAVLKLRSVLGSIEGDSHLTIESKNVDVALPNNSTNDILSSVLSGSLTNIESFRPGSRIDDSELYKPKETRLYVRNLPNGMDDAGLLNLFSKAGTVKSADVFKDNENRRATPFAYVVMSTLEEAIRAMYLFHRKNFDGRFLAVKIGEKEYEDDPDDLSSNRPDLEKRRLRVFLCHAHKDAVAVQAIYKHLIKNNVDAWLDKEKLLPGSNWEYEIREAVRASDIIIVCLSKGFDQKGFRQKEVRIALEESALQPEGEIFIIPARLEECEILPSLQHLQWVNLFESDGYDKLLSAFNLRAQKIGVIS